jgi:hypothetical protein
LTENTRLEEQLKDKECQNRQKQKEVDDFAKLPLILKIGEGASTRSLTTSRRHY